jgi:PAS domain S-box-containing protein
VDSRPHFTHGRRAASSIDRVSGDERYRSLVEAINDYAIFLLDADGYVATWNGGAQRIKGYLPGEIIGRHFSVFYPPENVARGYPDEELARAAAHGRWEDEGWRLRKDGSRFWANVVITALRDKQGVLTGYAKITRDMTERRRHEERTQQSEERLRRLMDAVEDGIFMLDPQGHVTSWNAGATRLKGFGASEIIGQHFSRFYPMEDIVAGKPQAELAAAAAHGRTEDESWRLRKDGSRFWANVIITAVYGQRGELIGFAAVTRDMTERNELRQLQYASELAARIEAAREEEKKRIARELHDDLGQQLTALKMGLVTVLADDTARAAQLRDAVDRAIVSVRRLAAGLRPAALDDFGLVPALEWLIDDCRQRSDLHVSLVTETQDVTFSEAASTALFRIVQESLSNAMRHALGATSVEVALICAASICDLKVSDNGTAAPAGGGDDTEFRKDRPPPSGLAGIRDRVRRLGGTVTAGPDAAGGFTVHISIPRYAVE